MPPDHPQQVASDPRAAEPAEDLRVASSAAGSSAGAAAIALARVARSFRIYDPKNALIQRMLTDYSVAIRACLREHGALDLAVRPFELVRDGEVVYLQREREESLAFVLFRDGVRRITVEPDAEDDELLRLVEVLALRFIRLGFGEDDTVTLLQRSGLRHVRIVAVEGFVPDDQDPETRGLTIDQRRALVPRMDMPQDFDLHDGPPASRCAVGWAPVPRASLAAMRSELGPERLAHDAVRAAADMLEAAWDPTDPTAFAHVAPYVEEVRDGLAAAGAAGAMAELLRKVRPAVERNEEGAPALVDSFVQGPVLDALVSRVLPGDQTAVGRLAELIALVPGNHGARLLALAASPEEAVRWTACRLLAKVAPAGLAELHRTVLELPGPAARDVLGALIPVLEDKGRGLAQALCAHESPDAQAAALGALSKTEPDLATGQAVVGLLRSPAEEVRSAAAALLGRMRHKEAFDALVRVVQQRAPSGLSRAEAEALGRSMQAVDPERASGMFVEWIRGKGLLRRFLAVPGQEMLQWTAVAGLGDATGDSPEELLRWLSPRAGEALHRHCQSTLARRHRGTRDG